MPGFELPTWTSFAEFLTAPDIASTSMAFFVAGSVIMVAIGAVTLTREVREHYSSASTS